MKFPLITIGIASYNALYSIEKAVNSALAQKWQPLEIIIVDDCSSDGTSEKLVKSFSKYKNIRIFKNKKKLWSWICSKFNY